MIIKKTIYNFYSFQFKFSLFNFSDSFCKHWATGLRFFALWKELNKCFWNFFVKGLFFAMLSILFTPLFLWLKSTACCT